MDIGSWSHEFGLSCIAAAHVEWLSRHLDGALVLDTGCGEGRLLGLLAERGASVVGVDLSADAVAGAEQKLPSRAGLLVGSVLALPFPDGVFDVVCSSEVIEHVTDPMLYLSELRRVLKPGGLCTISTPNGLMFYSPWPWNLGRLCRILFHPRRFTDTVSPEAHWCRALSFHPAVKPTVLRTWCRQQGFKILKHRGLLWSYYDPERWSPLAFFRLLERMRVPVLTLFTVAVNLVEKLVCLVSGIGFLTTTRQIILLRKQQS